MGELNGQILGMVIVIAIFAAITPLLISMFNDLTEDISTSITEVETSIGDLNDYTNNAIKIGNQEFTLLSYAD
ncbi:MAG: hypothetical protein LUC31_00115 [Coprobacillus sp.]|nr:hypothetical protein [Coprobacillus sp.]